MKLQREEKIVIVLLCMALGNLAVANWALDDGDLKVQGADNARDSSDAPLPDSGITVEGYIVDIQPTRTGGHIIIRLDTTTMPVFVHRDSGAEVVGRNVQLGARVRITGKLTEYQGQSEIDVERAAGVQVLG
jgi:DNA/RNA endonuclease YhcR with UshA esterase domain